MLSTRSTLGPRDVRELQPLKHSSHKELENSLYRKFRYNPVIVLICLKTHTFSILDSMLNSLQFLDHIWEHNEDRDGLFPTRALAHDTTFWFYKSCEKMAFC